MTPHAERLLRLVIFSPSLIADIDNPGATSTRALVGALSAAGQEVTHLERRGNPLLDRQLRVRGSAALRSLNARYPDVRVRQYDVPMARQQRGVWFGTEVSTADAVIALPGTPDEVLDLIAPFETPHLVRVVPPGAIGDLTIEPLICVEMRIPVHKSAETIAVAYDNIEAVMADVIPEDAERIVVGASQLPGWRYLPEVEVAERYRSASVAIVLERDERAEALARRLLPLAAGCRVRWRRSVEEELVVVNDGSEIPDENWADVVASRLVDRIRMTSMEKRRLFAAILPGARRS